MRSLLGRFLFKNDDVFLNVGDLSGGEKARLSLLKLMLGGANTLILDEPTNHMDIESKEVFEEALAEFPGTAIIISHDRYFLQRIPDRILELTPDGIIEYLGKYDYYVEKSAEVQSGKKYMEELSGEKAAKEELASAPVLSAEEQRRLNKQIEAEERRIRRKKEALEAQMADLEAEIEELENKMCDPNNSSDYGLLAELVTKIEEAKAKHDEAMEEWMLLEDGM